MSENETESPREDALNPTHEPSTHAGEAGQAGEPA